MSGRRVNGDMIYFDNAATSYPKPASVMRALTRTLRRAGGNPGRSSHTLALAAAETVDAVRCELATLFGASDPNSFVFTLNATHALNLAIKTRVRQGMHILISDREHNAVYRPVCRLARDGIADFDVFSTHGDTLASIRSLLRPKTGMLICNHISNVDGFAAPIEEIGKLCRERGIYFIVDASQSAGHMPISVEKIGADAFCAPAHKGLFGIQGCGFVWLRSGEQLAEFMEGGSGNDSRDPSMPSVLPERMEAGTLPTPAIAALGAGVRFILKETPEAIAEAESALLARLTDRISSLHGVTVYAPPRGGVCSFTCSFLSSDRLTRELDARDVCVRGGLHCAPLAHAALGTMKSGTVRVSLSYLNTAREVDEFSALLASVIKEAEADRIR